MCIALYVLYSLTVPPPRASPSIVFHIGGCEAPLKPFPFLPRPECNALDTVSLLLFIRRLQIQTATQVYAKNSQVYLGKKNNLPVIEQINLIAME